MNYRRLANGLIVNLDQVTTIDVHSHLEKPGWTEVTIHLADGSYTELSYDQEEQACSFVERTLGVTY